MTPARAICALALLLNALPAIGEPIRVASFNADLTRDGPGLLLRDIRRGNDEQISAVVKVIARISPDILALQGIDWDYEGKALDALIETLGVAGVQYSYRYAPRPNSGMITDLDLDGDGRLGGPGDAQGYGRFSGQEGLAVLSRWPILMDQAQDLSSLLWRDMPGADLPVNKDGTPFPSPEAQAIQRLSSTAHWIVPVQLPGGNVLSLLTFQATPPVFDGPEDRNGRRNRDEILIWRSVLDGALDGALNGLYGPAPRQPFVLAGGANLDPYDSDGRREAISLLLNDARFQDVEPRSDGAAQAGDQGHRGDDALDTVDWPRVGRMRVDYVLPSSDLRVLDSGVFWPAPDQPGYADALAASRHRLVWVDLALD